MRFQTSLFFSYIFSLIDYESGRILFTFESDHDDILHKFSLESTEVSKWKLIAELYPKNFAKEFVKNIGQFNIFGEDKFYTMLYTRLQALE